MERKVIEVDPIEDETDRAEYLSIKMDIENEYFMPVRRMKRFEVLEKKFGPDECENHTDEAKVR